MKKLLLLIPIALTALMVYMNTTKFFGEMLQGFFNVLLFFMWVAILSNYLTKKEIKNSKR